MATNDLPDDSFIREVDEEYRRDQLKGLWQRYGRALIVGIVLGLAALAGGLWWKQHAAEQAGASGEALTQALAKVETGDVAAATPALETLAKSDRPGYVALALLQQAANAVQGGDTDKALKLYAQVQADSRLAQPFRDLALVKSVQLQFDALTPGDVVARLKPLAVPGNPWFGVAGEMTAMAHIKAGASAQALPLLNALSVEAALLPTQRARAKQLATTLSAQTGATAVPAATAAAVPAPVAAPATAAK